MPVCLFARVSGIRLTLTIPIRCKAASMALKKANGDRETIMCDFPDVSKEKTVKARKDYTCCECSALISRGEEYMLIQMVYGVGNGLHS